MAGEYLPPVEARLTMDLGDFAAKIAEAKAMLKTLKDGVTIPVKLDYEGADAVGLILRELRDSSASLDQMVQLLGQNEQHLAVIQRDTADSSADLMMQTDLLRNSLSRVSDESIVATTNIRNYYRAAADAGGGGRFGIFGVGLTANALHWIIAGGAEILAVTVPALVALGAGLAVAAQGYVNVQAHMQSVYTATEATSNMFHTTAGQVVGLGNALQKAQDAANPSVYGVLGSAVITVNEHFGNLSQTGLQVVQMFQTFAAKIAVDFGPNGGLGGTVSSLLARMVPDLQQLGQVFGNTGHALLNFASAMPGLAEMLLSTLAGVTGLISHLSGLAPVLITVGMGFEEFQRWGGLAVTALNKLGLASIDVSGKWYSLEHLGSVFQGLMSVLPTVTSMFAKFLDTIKLSSAASAVENVAQGMAKFITLMGPNGAIALGAFAIGIGILIDKAVTARSVIQDMTDAMQKSVLGASNQQSQTVAINNMAALNAQLATVKQNLANATSSTNTYSGAWQNTYRAQVIAKNASDQLNAGIQQQQQDVTNTVQGATLLARTYGTTLPGALALADAANVKLASGITGSSQSAEIARMQIASLVQGYTSMGAPITAVGADVTALSIAAGLQNSKVNQLNSAWDSYMKLLTGGTSNLAGFVTSMSNMGNVVANFSNNLGKAVSIKDSVSQFAQALTGFGTKGAAAWQNFDQVVGGTAPQLIDWMRTAGAAGALSGPQFTNAVLGMASSLMPLAADSKTAQAEVLGLVHQVLPGITTWGQLTSAVKSSGASMKDTTSAVETATSKLGDMAKVAQNLGTVMQSALISTLSSAKIAASGAGGAMQTYEQDIMNAGTSASKTAGDRAQLIADLQKLGYTAQQAAQLVGMVTNNINAMPSGKTVTITTLYKTVGSPVSAGASLNPGYATGTSGAAPGWAWVGEAGPELVKFNGGERVIPSHVATGYAGGTGAGGDTHVHVYMDGKQIYSGVAKQAVQSQRRTGHNGMTRRTR